MKMGGDFNEEDETRGHGAAVVLAGALAGPDGTRAGVAGAVIPRQHQKKRNRNRKVPQAHKNRSSNSRTKSYSTRDRFNSTSK